MPRQAKALGTLPFNRLFIFLLVLFLSCTATATQAFSWQKLAPGIFYTDLKTEQANPWGHVHTFRVNLHTNKMGVICAQQLTKRYATAKEFLRFTQSLIAINGGFFDPRYQPLGLRISDHKQLNPIKHISWWGVFYVKDNIAHIKSAKQFSPSPNIEFAVQSGPRLLVKGHLSSLKPGSAERTALGISRNGDVIIIVTENAPMTLSELAKLMQSPFLACKNALNLDGGSSTQLSTLFASLRLNVLGFSSVSDAVTVTTRS
jgi:uncharacterized protein YigE (DUF2233 family)